MEEMRNQLESFLKTRYPLKLDLQTFADGDDKGDDKDDDKGTGGDDAFATFKSKEELDKRLGRAERKGQKELAQSLGFDSVEAMQEALNKSKDQSKDQSKDKDKDKGKDTDVDALVDARLAEKLAEQEKKTFTRLLTAEVKVLSSNPEDPDINFTDWEDALSLADFSEVKEDDKGNLTGVREALLELAKKKPHLLKKQSGGSFGAPVPKKNEQSKETRENLIKMAQTRGAVSQSNVFDPWNKS